MATPRQFLTGFVGERALLKRGRRVLLLLLIDSCEL